jgi:hypothetical protein
MKPCQLLNYLVCCAEIYYKSPMKYNFRNYIISLIMLFFFFFERSKHDDALIVMVILQQFDFNKSWTKNGEIKG